MATHSRGRVAGALVLIGLGVWLMAVQLSPAVRAWAYGRQTWPLEILIVAALLLLIGVLAGAPGWVIPACILGGLGGLLYYQNLTGAWASWAYAWTLLPGFVGVGLLVFGLLRTIRNRPGAGPRGPWIAAAWLLAVSTVLFVVFSAFLGGPRNLAQWWPAGLIALGLVFLAQSWARRRPA